MQFYNAGLDQLADWETATYEWALVTAGTFTTAPETVADTGATIIGPRLEATGKVRTVDTAVWDAITYRADDPSWAGLADGDLVSAVLLYRVVTDDSDSIPIGWWDMSPAVSTDDPDPLVFEIGSGLVAYTDQGA